MSPSKIKLAKEEKKRLRELKKEHRKELERLRESQNAQIAKVRRQAITRPARVQARSTRSCVVFTPAPLQKKTCKNQTPARAAASPRRRGGSEDGWTEGGEVETWMTRMDVDARRSLAVRRAGVARVACLTDARRAPTVLVARAVVGGAEGADVHDQRSASFGTFFMHSRPERTSTRTAPVLKPLGALAPSPSCVSFSLRRTPGSTSGSI